MKSALLAVSSSFLLAAFPPKTRVENVVDYFRENPSSAELHVVTPEIREEVIEQLRQYAQGFDPRLKDKVTPETDARIALIRLHDQEFVDQFIRGINSWAAGGKGEAGPAWINYLHQTRDPSFIPYFSQDFMREDGIEVVEHQDGDISWSDWPPSIDVAVNVLKLTVACREFAQPTREWAKTCGDKWYVERVGVAQFRQVMRDWWKENEQFFQTQNYQAVTPGRSLPLPAQVVAESTEAPTVNETSGTVQPAPTGSTPIAAASEVSTPSAAYLWTGAVAAIALLVSLAVFWKRRA